MRKLLKGIETGDAASAAVVDEAKYIQHNPQTHEGSEGLAELFARLAKTNPKVTFIRVFEDGDFAFAHNEYNFTGPRAAFEVFRFENGQAVEHWDNIQSLLGPNPSGRDMLGGTAEIADLHLTEANRADAKVFVENCLIPREFSLLDRHMMSDLIQHNPELPDGLAAYREAMARETDGAPDVQYNKLHKVLAEGNFVLCMSEGTLHGAYKSFYDLFRFENGKIA